MITTLFNKLNIILKLQIYIDLVTCSHSDCSLARSWEPAGISRELARDFFKSLHISLAARFKLEKRGKRKKRKLKEEEEERKKKRGEKRKRGKRKKIFFHLFLPSFMQGEWITESEGSEAWRCWVATILLACFSVLHVTVTRRFQFTF